MGWLEGVLTGYADRHYEIEAEKRREAELAATREQQVYETLLNSKYPEIKNLAAAGVLDLANPRRKAGGFAGWMGEIQKSPYLGMIQRTRQQIADDPAYADAQLGRTSPEQGGQPPVTPSIPSSAGSVAPPPPGAPSAALPSTSQVTGGPAPGVTPPPAPGGPQAAAPPQPPSPYSTWGKFTQEFYGGQPPAPPTQVPPAIGAPPQAAGPTAVDPATGQPVSPAGPPLQVSAGTPPPAGQVSPGQPGATTQPAGRMPPPPPTRTNLINPRPRPGIFPTAADTQRDQAAAQVGGKIDAYAEMYRAQGYDDATAYRMAADLFERDVVSGRGSGMPYMSTRAEYTDPTTGETVRTPVTFDKNTGRYLLPNGQPAPADLRIVPAGRFSQSQEAAAIEMGLPSASAATPEQMPDLIARAREIEAGNITAKPLSAAGSSGLAARLAGQWNAIQTPIRLMELNLRNMATNYRAYKAGDRGAWETMRTAFVHIGEPNSVVMPSEFARAAGVSSIKDYIWGTLEKARIGGSVLTDEQIDEMVRAADAMWQGVATYGSQQRSAIEAQIADPRLGVSPAMVFGTGDRYLPDWGTGDPAAASGPPPPPAPTAAPTAAPAVAPPAAGAAGPVNWNTPLQYDPVTRKMVPRP